MMRLQVELNGNKITMATPDQGIVEAHCLLTHGFPAYEDKSRLSLTGLDRCSEESRHLRWGAFDLAVGDKVTFTVLGGGHGDEPIDTYPSRTKDEKREQEQERARHVARKYGWTIIESGDE